MILDSHNPWSGINWNNTVADCDRAYFDQHFGSPSDYASKINAKNPEAKLDFNCLPEPFSGDIESEVYCLNMNPGAPDKDFTRGADQNGDYVLQAQGIMTHNLKSHYFDDMVADGNGIRKDFQAYSDCMDRIFAGKNLKEYKNNRTALGSIRPHDGAVWQREMWGPMKKAIGDMEKREGIGKGEGHFPNIFVIEYFPYHSAGGFVFPKYLPSYGYSNFLVKKAIEEEKLIIIMRKEELWYERIDGLKGYANKLLLRNHQRVWLSPGNLCRAVDIPRVMPEKACLTLDDILKKM